MKPRAEKPPHPCPSPQGRGEDACAIARFDQRQGLRLRRGFDRRQGFGGQAGGQEGGRGGAGRGARLWLCLEAALLIGLGCAAGGAVKGATFTATLDRDTITLGDNATLSLNFSGGTPSKLPAVPDQPNLQIQNYGTSTQASWVNGQSTIIQSYNFSVTATEPGVYTIPALSAVVAGQTLTTQPLQLRVVKPTAPPVAAVQSGSEPVFLRLLLPKKEVYVGESVVAQVQIYIRNGLPVSSFQPTGFPAEGFNIGKQVEGQHRLVQVGQSVYTMIPLSVVLRAIKAGTMTLGPYTARAVLGSNDPFDMFFGRGGQQQQLSLTSESETVKLLPLPGENAPQDFTGAVGSYTMHVTAGPTNVAVGDPITVRVQVSGHGWLDAVTLPAQTAWRDFNTYPPTAKVQLTDNLGLQGTKTFEEVVAPQNADVRALPPVTFSFFDPDRKAYRTLEQPAIPLEVRAAASAGPMYVASKNNAQDNSPVTQDIVANKQRLGALGELGPPVVQRGWFLGLQGLPLLAFMTAVVWRKRTDKLANNPRLRRRRQVAQVVQAGLGELRGLAAANKSDEFFAKLFHLLQEQLGERLDMPATAITEAVVGERLRPRGVGEETLAPLEELFQKCNLARYAPLKSSEELAALIPQLEAVLASLREVEA
jgi:BatD DUF11 like domain